MAICRKRAHPRRRRKVLRRWSTARPLLMPLHRLDRLLRASTACSACSTSPRYCSAEMNHVGVLLHHSRKPRACPGASGHNALVPAQLFSGSSEYVQQAERTSCLSYDQYSNEVWKCTLPHDHAIRHDLDC